MGFIVVAAVLVFAGSGTYLKYLEDRQRYGHDRPPRSHVTLFPRKPRPYDQERDE